MRRAMPQARQAAQCAAVATCGAEVCRWDQSHRRTPKGPNGRADLAPPRQTITGRSLAPNLLTSSPARIPSPINIRPNGDLVTRTAALLTLFAIALTACSNDSPLPTSHMSHPGSLMLSDLTQASSAQAL